MPQEPSLDFWQPTSPAQVRQLGSAKLSPQRYCVMTLDFDKLKSTLTAIATDGSLGPLVALPLPDGSRVTFRLRAATVMAPELAARYPELRTYAGEVPNRPADRVRLELTPAGLRAMLVYAGQSLLIEPYRPNDTAHYLCFDKASLPAGSKRPFEKASPEGN